MSNKNEEPNELVDAILDGFDLIHKYLSQKLTPNQFCIKYSHKWAQWIQHKIPFPSEIEILLNDLHSDCDVFWSKQEIKASQEPREKWMIDEDQLLKLVQEKKNRLYTMIRTRLQRES